MRAAMGHLVLEPVEPAGDRDQKLGAVGVRALVGQGLSPSYKQAINQKRSAKQMTRHIRVPRTSTPGLSTRTAKLSSGIKSPLVKMLVLSAHGHACFINLT